MTGLKGSSRVRHTDGGGSATAAKPPTTRRQASRDDGRPQKASSRAAAGTRTERVREVNLLFKDAHKYGTAALKARDYKRFGEAIAVERSLIQEQAAEIEQQRVDIQKQRAIIKATSRRNSSKHTRYS